MRSRTAVIFLAFLTSNLVQYRSAGDQLLDLLPTLLDGLAATHPGCASAAPR